MIVTESWFIAAIIVCVGGAIWLAVCAIAVWLWRCRRRPRQTNKGVINGSNYSNHRGKSGLSAGSVDFFDSSRASMCTANAEFRHHTMMGG